MPTLNHASLWHGCIPLEFPPLPLEVGLAAGTAVRTGRLLLHDNLLVIFSGVIILTSSLDLKGTLAQAQGQPLTYPKATTKKTSGIGVERPNHPADT